MKINITFYLTSLKEELFLTFQIRLLDPFSSKLILLKQVYGFIWKFSNFKHDTLNYYDGCFKYSKEGHNILLPRIGIPRRIDVTIEIFLRETVYQRTFQIYF